MNPIKITDKRRVIQVAPNGTTVALTVHNHRGAIKVALQLTANETVRLMQQLNWALEGIARNRMAAAYEAAGQDPSHDPTKNVTMRRTK